MAFDDGIGNNQDVPYYPTDDYLKPTKKNKGTPWAAMRFPVESLRALAKSEAYANHHGLLDKDTTQYYLPSALTEGRWEDYGVNQVAINQRNTPAPEWNQIQAARDKAVTTAYQKGQISPASYLKGYKKYNYADEKIPGVTQLNQLMNSEQYWDSSKVPDSVKKTRDAANKLGFDKYFTEIRPTGSGFGKYDIYTPSEGGDSGMYSPENLANNAALKTLALINKREESGRTGLDLWERYNGDGPKARDYRKKIQTTHDLMSHSKNKDFYKVYRNLVKHYENELQSSK